LALAPELQPRLLDLPEIIAADSFAPAIATPALVDAGTTNVERILCAIHILHASFCGGLSNACPALQLLEGRQCERGPPCSNHANVPLIVGEYGCWYPFQAASVNIETDLGCKAVA